MSLPYCVKEQKPCIHWVEKYFKDCLCNLKDEISFGCGLISLICWGIAEIPQIFTNFRTKSSHGVSLTFLLTWIAGDIFNLVGCFLEPATLPTQFYTALLYTISTIVLVLQSIYYDYVCQWCHSPKIKDNQLVEEEKKPLNPKSTNSSVPIPSSSSTISTRREFYYTSARSLAGSETPPFRIFLRVAKSGPSSVMIDDDSSSDDNTTIVSSKKFTKPKSIPRPVGIGTFLAASVTLPPRSRAFGEIYVGFKGRRFIQENEMEHSVYGQWLGWLMAAIYMGGRIPQIYLNIKRGSVEGLNPLMFIFALVANVAYVGSILVRTTEWENIEANFPWLLDAAVCVVLDFFIILQYIYYRYFGTKIATVGDKYTKMVY